METKKNSRRARGGGRDRPAADGGAGRGLRGDLDGVGGRGGEGGEGCLKS